MLFLTEFRLSHRWPPSAANAVIWWKKTKWSLSNELRKEGSEALNLGRECKGWSNAPLVFNIMRLVDFTSCSLIFYLAGVQVLPFSSFVFVLFVCCWCSLSLLDARRRWPIRAELFCDLTCLLITTFILSS